MFLKVLFSGFKVKFETSNNNGIKFDFCCQVASFCLEFVYQYFEQRTLQRNAQLNDTILLHVVVLRLSNQFADYCTSARLILTNDFPDFKYCHLR